MEELVRETMSVCPECFRVIPAKIVNRDGKLYMVKTCPEHGGFEELYWSDYELYKKYMQFFKSGQGISNPQASISKGCPWDCGLCPLHMSSSVLTNIDVTNRCNLRCPICFANAAKAGYIWEPSIEEIGQWIDNLLKEQPPGLAVQFSGGEPTVRDDLPEIIKLAIDKGVKQVMIASNGIRLAEDYDYYKRLRYAGLSTVYLQFDGVTPEPYCQARGFNALPLKVKVIENTRRMKEETGDAPTLVLVPTVVKGVNDGQVGDIIRYAAKNVDVVKSVDFQPVAITGRINKQEREKMRITIPDLLDRIEEQTNGQIRKEDFYTIPVMYPIIEWLREVSKNGDRYPRVRTHPVCGAGTYVFVYGKELVPITRIIDVDKLIALMEKGVSKTELIIRSATLIRKEGLKYAKDFLPVLKSILTSGDFSVAANFHKLPNILFIGAMHFQDPYNFDVERVMRCVIHYALPEGKIIPFCAYNNFYREEYEKRYSRPVTDDEKKEFLEQVRKIEKWREEFKDFRLPESEYRW